MKEIAEGKKGWGDIKEYAPALTYKEDMVDWYED